MIKALGHVDSSRVYVDLEMTVIDNFQNGHLINVDKLKQLPISTKDRQHIRIFSFAIFNDLDKADFAIRLWSKIEEALGWRIVEIISIEEMMKADLELTGVRFDPQNGVDVSEWINMRGKVDAFRNYCLNSHIGRHACTYTLIDDVVPNMSIRIQDNWATVRYINIDTTTLLEGGEFGSW